MMVRLVIAAGMAAGLSLAAHAQTTAPATGHATPPDAFRVFGDKELATLSSGKTALVLGTLVDHENHYVLIAGRTGPGEKRGGTLTGGTVVTIHPGDFIVVPAGQPHLTMVKPGTTFRAVIIK